MNVLEYYCTWTGTVVDAFNKIAGNLVSLISTTLSITSNNLSTNSESAIGKDFTKVPDIFQETILFFGFDDFQYQLLQVFLCLLLSNICLIYIAWYIYGSRISERFMTPSFSTQDLKHSVLQLKLPKEHSQRYS